MQSCRYHLNFPDNAPSLFYSFPLARMKDWTEGAAGWVLCDACENVVCPLCTTSLGLLVSDLFYCPPCSGSGQSAAATVGGVVASAVAACAELEALPLSFKAVQRILTNLSKSPDEIKYRRLRLENPAVRKYVDLAPVLRILTSIGFVRKEEERSVEEGSQSNGKSINKPPVEQVLVLEGDVDAGQIKDLLKILDGLSSESPCSSATDITSKAERMEDKRSDSSGGDAATSSEGMREESSSSGGNGTCNDIGTGRSTGTKRSPDNANAQLKLEVATNNGDVVVDEPSAKKQKEV